MNKTIETELGNKEIFAQNLKKYLKLSGKTQVEVATAIKVSKGTFCDWTRARAYPRMDKVQALADFFGIKKSDLVEEEVIVEEDPMLEEDQKVLDLFHQVPEEKREFVLSLIRAAIDNL